jgi:hypothetical protein
MVVLPLVTRTLPEAKSETGAYRPSVGWLVKKVKRNQKFQMVSDCWIFVDGGKRTQIVMW